MWIAPTISNGSNSTVLLNPLHYTTLHYTPYIIQYKDDNVEFSEKTRASLKQSGVAMKDLGYVVYSILLCCTLGGCSDSVSSV